MWGVFFIRRFQHEKLSKNSQIKHKPLLQRILYFN